MGKQHKIKILFSDLDGTLLTNDKKIGSRDVETLKELGKLGIVRVFATGRTFFNSMQVLNDDTPFDFLIFSSGAGIYDWKNKTMLFRSIIPKKTVEKMSQKLIEFRKNFSVHRAIPHNQKYQYFLSYNDELSDFNYRNKLNADICSPLTNAKDMYDATQMLIITMDLSDLQLISSTFPNMKTIRASSPIDGKSIWIEIFNPDVSKAKGANFLCEKLGINTENTLSIGNDYNDIDLLNWSKISFVVDNAPLDIKSEYLNCCSNMNNPLSDVCKTLNITT